MEEPQTAVSPLFGVHQGGIIYTANSWSRITGSLYNIVSTTSETLGVGKRQLEAVSQYVLCAL